MFTSSRVSLTILLLAASCVTADLAWAGRHPQVVVLRNGNVLKGHVQNVNQRLVVSSQGNRRVTRVPLDDVDFVCADMNAAYRRKLSRLDGGNVEQHIRLAHWCLKYDLRDHAVDRLLYLNQVAPHHTAVRALESRLRRLASRPPSVPRVAEAQKAVTTSPSPMTSKDLPADSLADFTRMVQPLLLNRCGQATCHGASSTSSFRVTAGLRGTPNRERTWDNLAAVVRHVNPQDYASSPLLLKARAVHGNGRRAPIGPHELKQYQRLVDWVKQLSDPPKASTATPELAAKSNPARPQTPRLDELDPDHPFAAIFAARRKAEAAQSSAQSPANDPFDPKTYNSQFSGKR